MRMRVAIPWFVALAAGCFGADPAALDLTPTEPAPAAPARFLDFRDCSEMNFVQSFPSALDSFPPFIRPVRTANYLTTNLITIFGCAAGSSPSGSEEGPATYTFLYPVEEIEFTKLPGAAGYVYLTEVRTQSRIVLDAFGPYVGSDETPTAIAFTDFGSWPEGRGRARVGPANDSIEYDTAMLEAPRPGSGGILGLYTADLSHVHLHTVTFGDYSSYPTGSGTITYPPTGAAPAPQSEAWPASHNVHYDLRFDFDTLVVKGWP